MRRALAAAVLACSALFAHAEESASGWLERMFDASRQLSYEGTFVYVNGHALASMRVMHQGTPEGERQRVYALNGEPREVVQGHDGIACLAPCGAPGFDLSGRPRALLPVNLPRSLDDLADNYELILLGWDRVAGLDTRVVAIRPRDALRFGYHLWLERDSGVLLRSVLLDEGGSVVEQLMFTDFRVVDAVDASAFEPQTADIAPRAAEPFHRLRQAEAGSGVAWQIGALPAGFSLVSHNRYATGEAAVVVEHMVFTDGLATVSAFIEPQVSGQPLVEGHSRMGAMNAYGTLVDGYQLLLLGEVPGETVQRMAAALTPGARQ